jgi:hypothetical protein
VKIVKVTQDDFNEWLELTLKLWPDESREERQISLTKILQSPREAWIYSQILRWRCDRIYESFSSL